MSSEAVRLVRVALDRHDLDADDDTCQRVAALVLAAGVDADRVAEVLDHNGIALAGDPNTRLAAADIVATLIGGDR